MKKPKRRYRLVSPKTFQDGVDLVLNDLRQVLLKKQADYGYQNITDFGEYGCLVRANDKISRLKNLGKKVAPNFESIEDSWVDLANYAIIALMLRRKVFELPLK